MHSSGDAEGLGFPGPEAVRVSGLPMSQTISLELLVEGQEQAMLEDTAVASIDRVSVQTFALLVETLSGLLLPRWNWFVYQIHHFWSYRNFVHDCTLYREYCNSRGRILVLVCTLGQKGHGV